MGITVQAISSHPLLTQAVEKILREIKGLDVRVLPAAATAAEATRRPGPPRLFLLDGCALQTDLGRIASRCRADSPGSKCLALLSPSAGDHAEKIRLFYWGIDGFVELRESWQAELPRAIHSVVAGHPWVPAEVLMTFVNQTKALLERQTLPGQSLTAREGQVLQLLMRHMTNKEISRSLAISERTVKFHVSNILAKLNVADRNGLSPERFAATPLAAD